MNLLQLREKEIFETLRKLKKFKLVVIGGYAVNAYTLPRFSVDCDVVVENNSEAKRVGKELGKFGYKEEKFDKITGYYDKFVKYEKEVYKNFRVSVDILITGVFDRLTMENFSAKWVFENSSIKLLRGKTMAEKLKLRVVDIDSLIVMKSISCRVTDIRDVFMLMPQAKDAKWIKDEISKRYSFNDRFKKIKDKITSAKFKDNLQGVYGYVDNKIFEKHKNAVLELEKI